MPLFVVRKLQPAGKSLVRLSVFVNQGKKHGVYKMSLTSQPLCYDMDRAAISNRMTSCFSAGLPIQKAEDAPLPLGLAQTWGKVFPISSTT